MKKIILALLFATGSVYANPYNWQITRVIDGDTVAVHAPWVPDPIKKEISIRVYGVDTPEKGFRAKCSKEDQLGRAATEFTKKAVAGAKQIQVEVREWDKYGGRILGDVLLDGVSLRTQLIGRGYAREYYGEAKTSWCN
jgi:endonuclease YncB( thermonuclease family)